ncbi:MULTISPECIES: 2-C-methyl-D-erythritol 2,4-cyclodiphosphate synthase [Mobiluncus]|uniref:2-C-methyl-D-erythritol 2,4-cyclodiphosphate synthase n=1 Tax=Mobiluncus holmesii ATCC 35242 TaxID=887899 RepID=E6M567_9ACTO|nr:MULTISPECIES: 2-C-methyl-D-erythritol 2,4-cyclodiphosphate synthase [Mobiluncus]EFL93326.1 2-C-methyl-D-erythritol 2,4-cyclodiphosphate synthase [Mobiluncus curtisii subsp. curtisii ATCC 35241]EFU81615.1 2-C-methyl-D-erythritol 2,4-cyclodiphosphate synthase [Mobiluncus holmesii ATCC 35242]MCV0021140.1 2-C-methyl-D-erythritol 2,4-cyclodiphosphate synthase [Mobiluncus curtisii]NMW43613.1 2-C-methyl-D-erythritol 2,4-cyclodiphosphate synthase [Mobiluncus curtisii]NMW47710.1 2-C-methyl-D-erythri
MNKIRYHPQTKVLVRGIHHPKGLNTTDIPIRILCMDFRVGQGFDAHRFAAGAPVVGRPLRVGTLSFPDHAPLEGHSDGDVAAHALTDALLAAAGLGDLGTNFGVSRPEYAGASGEVFLRAAMRMLHETGWVVVNASVTVVGQEPRLGPHYAEAEAALGNILAAPVSFSATTTDRMGFTGNKEGLAALAICLLRRE